MQQEHLSSQFASKSVPSFRGFHWISRAWGLFKEYPGQWIGLIILTFLTQMIFNLIPVVGIFSAILLAPLSYSFFRIAFVQDTQKLFDWGGVIYVLKNKFLPIWTLLFIL